MTSNLGCIGLAVEDADDLDRLIAAVLPAADSLGRVGDVEVFRWQDASGARLIIDVEGGERVGLLPSFAGTPGAFFANLKRVNDKITTVDVVDSTGEQLTSAAVELEQRRLQKAIPIGGQATLVALGIAVTVHESPEESQSFLAAAVFGASEDADAYARLAGTVLRAERRSVAQTGQQFIAARVRTTGFELDVCLAASDHPTVPTPGQTIAGTVFLVASLRQHRLHKPKKYGWRRD